MKRRRREIKIEMERYGRGLLGEEGKRGSDPSPTNLSSTPQPEADAIKRRESWVR